MTGAAIAAAAVLLTGTEPALAQLRAEMASESVMRPAGLMTATPGAAARQTSLAAPAVLGEPRSDALMTTPTMPISYTTQFMGSTLQLDMPRYDSSGKYVRPKFYFGMQSDSMKTWMKAAGLEADKCMLPMLRARTHMSGDGELSGTLWVYARCTIR